MSIVKATLTEARRLIMVMTFNDDSSASRPPPSSPSIPSKCVRQFMSHILLSAEMHNFPSGVAPFPGAETGMGAKVTASTVGYSVGALNIPGYELPWEETLRVGEAADATDPRDRRLEGRVRSSSASR